MNKLWIFLLLMLTVPCLLAATTTFGQTDAYRCYTESRIVISVQGIGYCTNAISDSDLNRRDLAATYSNRGIIYAGNGKYTRAIKDQSRAISLKPNMGAPYANRGNVYYRTHEYEKALLDYNHALTIEGPHIAVTYFNRGLTLLKMNRVDEAVNSLHQGLELNPDSKRILDMLEIIKEL